MYMYVRVILSARSC